MPGTLAIASLREHDPPAPGTGRHEERTSPRHVGGVGGGTVVSATPGPAAAQAPPPATGAAALAGDWYGIGGAGSRDRLRFAGTTLTFFGDVERSSEYEVDLAGADGVVTVRVIRVVHVPSGSSAQPRDDPSPSTHHRRDGDAGRFVGLGRPGQGVMSPIVATLNRRCR
jgi:hypothetical protein